MKTVVVGSTNPVKLATTKEAFEKVYPDETFTFVAHKAVSGVSEQPMGDEETRTGARNRCADCRTAEPEADFWVGLEGGLLKLGNEYWVMAWICIEGKDGTVGYGKSSSFLLPPEACRLIDQGIEVDDAADMMFDEQNSKQKFGMVGLLTDNRVTRTDQYRDAVVYALIPFVKPALYPKA